MKKRFIFISLILFLISIELIEAQRGDVYAISILRVDGIIAPYAHYTNGEWKSVDDRTISRVANWQPEWYLKFSADSTMVIQTGTEVIYDPGYQNSGHGFLSTYPVSNFEPNNIFPRRKIGVAFSWDQPHSRFEEPKDENTKQVIQEMVSSQLDGEEQGIIDEGKNSWEADGKRYVGGIPEDKTARDTVSVTVRILSAENNTGNSKVHYVSAQKYYSSAAGVRMPMLNGWIIETHGNMEFSKAGFGVGDIDGKMLPTYLNPFASFEHEGRIFIASGATYYEGEDYFLFEVKDGEVSSVLKPFY